MPIGAIHRLPRPIAAVATRRGALTALASGVIPILQTGVVGLSPQCPEGFVAIGGTYAAGSAITLSGADRSHPEASDPRQWFTSVRVTNISGTGNTNLLVGAVCLQATRVE